MLTITAMIVGMDLMRIAHVRLCGTVPQGC